MTTRHSGYLVVLENRIREDNTKILDAIRQLKGVSTVEPVETDVDSQLAERRAKNKIIDEIWELLTE